MDDTTHDMGKTEKKPTKGLLKPFIRFIILMILMFIYLFIGAVIFSRLENDNNIASQRRFYDSLVDFVHEHQCVTNDSLREFFDSVNEAIRMSVVSITRQSRIREADILWDIPSSFFFTSTIVTTIGYGNFAPTTEAGRIFCSFYAFIGIPLTGWFLLTVGDALQVHWAKIRGYTHRLTVRIPNDSVRWCIHFAIYTIVIAAILLLIPGAIFARTEGWAYQDAVYYCFITFSTIGFGDLVAGDIHKHNASLWMLNVAHVIFLLMGLSVMSMALKGMGKSQRKNYRRAKTAVRSLVNKASRRKKGSHERKQENISPSEVVNLPKSTV